MILPEGAERAADALAVERSSAVRRALNEIRAEAIEERISRNEAAARVVALVDRLGLQAVTLDDLPEPIGPDDVAVVCWMAILAEAQAGGPRRLATARPVPSTSA